MSVTTEKNSGIFAPFAFFRSIPPHRDRGTTYTEKLRDSGKLFPCDDLYQQMKQNETSWRDAVKADWSKGPLVSTLLTMLAIMGMDGTEDVDVFQKATARSGFARDTETRYLASRAQYNRDCLRETVAEPAADAVVVERHEMAAAPEIAPWQVLLIGVLSVFTGAELIRMPSSPGLSPSFGSGLINTNHSPFFSSADYGA